MPLVATAVRIEAKLPMCGPPWIPTRKLPQWNPVHISAMAVAAGTTSLKKVMALLVLANTLTLQKLTRKYTTTSAAEINRPGTVNSPWPLAACRYSPCAQAQGQELMYCTDASASTGITDTMAIQAAQPDTNPTSEPWE